MFNFIIGERLASSRCNGESKCKFTPKEVTTSFGDNLQVFCTVCVCVHVYMRAYVLVCGIKRSH